MEQQLQSMCQVDDRKYGHAGIQLLARMDTVGKTVWSYLLHCLVDCRQYGHDDKLQRRFRITRNSEPNLHRIFLNEHWYNIIGSLALDFSTPYLNENDLKANIACLLVIY